jgi:hypothetical protein
MGFKENNTHGKGRPKGSVNKITLDNRERITNFLDENYNQFQEDLNSLPPKDRVRFYLELYKLVTPKMRSLELNDMREEPTKIEVEIIPPREF